MKILLAIPAYNEEKMIGKVLQSLPKTVNGKKITQVLVVNDGSTDNTSFIAKQYKAHVVSHLLNRGLGGALKTIFSYAKNQGFDILITIDADGQHSMDDLPQIIQPLLDKTSDVVIGTRWKYTSSAPLTRRFVNSIANVLTYLLFGIKTSDSQSGFRGFNRKAIDSIRLQSDGMEVSSEFFREIYINKLKFMEVPIHAIYSHYSQEKGQRLSNAINVSFQLLMRLLQ